MKNILKTVLLLLITTNLTYSQNIIDNKKHTTKFLKKILKGNIWVMDTMKSYTGQGSTEWDFDYTEIVKARNTKGLPTLIETEEKIEGTESWQYLYHAEITYFNNDTISEYKLNQWSPSDKSWVSDYSYYETKNETGNVLIHYTRDWDDDYQTFTQGNKEIYTYNSNGLKELKEDKDWNYTENLWEDYAKTYYYYDENNNDTLALEKRFISTDNWRDNWKTKYVYDNNNRIILKQQWGYDADWDEWYDYSKTTFSYYDNGFLKSEFTENYDYDNLEWYDLSKNNYYYDENNLLSYKEELDLQNDGNNLKYQYTYNTNNQEETFFLYDWNGDDWILFYKVYDNYDANGNQTDYYSQMSDGTWQNYLKEEYSWNELSVNINNLSQYDIKIYPNPVSNTLTIKNNSQESYEIELFDITGKLFYKTFSKSSTLKLNISNYPNGTYFVNIIDNEKKSFKFIKK